MRYTVNNQGVPANAAPALMPALQSSPTSSWWGWSRITGHPGDRPIPVHKPGVHSISPQRSNQPSWCAPDVLFPSQYWTTPDVAWRHVPVRPQEMMPVPATNLYNMAGQAMRPRRVGGRYQVAQPGVVQQWPDLLGRLTASGMAAGAPLPPAGR